MSLLQVIDVGTNSVRSIIVEVPAEGPFRVIDDEKDMTRLGEGLERTGLLSPEAMDRTVAALLTMSRVGRRLDVDHVRVVGTEALRRGANAGELLDRVTDVTGLDVEVVSPEEEGRLVWLSAASLSKRVGVDVALDIGGGSVEVIQAVDAEPVEIASMRLGARVLTERFLTDDPASDESLKKLRKHVRRELAEGVARIGPVDVAIIGSGGTINSIASAVAGGARRTGSLHGVEASRDEIAVLLETLTRSTVTERLKIPGMPPERVDTITAGTVVLTEALRLFDAPGIVVNARGIREGIVIDTLSRAGVAELKPDLMRGVRDLGARYRYDREHAEQVTRMALSIFDQTAGPLGLDSATRPLLEAAAMLHDIGYYVADDRHHEHSYHLIIHSALPMLTSREQRMVAAIARYHTKAMPKQRHAAWSELDPADRPAVRELASVLRLADGLDRGRAAHTFDLRVIVEDEIVRLVIGGADELHTEVAGVEKKRDLFEETFGRRVIVEGGRGAVRGM